MSEGIKNEYMVENQAIPLSFYDRAMMDFAHNILTGELEVLRSFSKLMITLSISLFPVYFAVLEFIDTSKNKASFLIIILTVIFSIFLLVSLFLFAMTLFPSKSMFVPEDLASIKEFRDMAMREKNKYVISGLITFSISLISMVTQFLMLLYSNF